MKSKSVLMVFCAPLAVSVAIWATSPAADAGEIFVANTGAGTIGEYDSTTGATINASLISGLNNPQSIAISGGDLFVLNQGSGSVGEYTTSGAVVNASLITGLGINVAEGITVSGGDLFVVKDDGQDRQTGLDKGLIGEYTTSGATVNASLVTLLDNNAGFDPVSIAASGIDLFVVNQAGTVGEYTTTGATINGSLVTDRYNSVLGVAVSEGNLFLTGVYPSAIGEYDATSGAAINASLVTSGFNSDPSLGPLGITVAGGDLFVANGDGTIGEYTTSGDTVNAALITGADGLFGIAVVTPEPSTWLTLAIGTGALLAFGLRHRSRHAKHVFVLLAAPLAAAVGVSATPATARGGEIFVTSYSDGTVGQYTGDGATANASFVTGLDSPTAIDASGGDLYVANFANSGGTIGEFDATTGAAVNVPFATGLGARGAWRCRGATFLSRICMGALTRPPFLPLWSPSLTAPGV